MTDSKSLKLFVILLTISLISFIDLSSAAFVNQTHGLNFSATWNAGSNVKVGFKFSPYSDLSFREVYKNDTSKATTAYLLNSSKGVLAQATFSGNIANFESYNISLGSSYYIACSNSSGWVAARTNNGLSSPFPISTSLFDVTAGLDNAETDNSIDLGCITQVTVESVGNISLVSTTYNTSSFETARENFFSNLSLTPTKGISSASLNYNGTSYSASYSKLDSMNYTVSSNIDIPSGSTGSKSWFWIVNFNDSTQQNMTIKTQNINSTIFGLCNTTLNTPYINITFKNETTNQESLSASAVSTWQYWLGSGSVNKTLSYTNTAQNSSYAFCSSPNTTGLSTVPSFIYSNLESPARTYAPGQLTLTSTVSNKVLFLLPVSLGQYVTFQVINPANQVISGVAINISSSTFGFIESRTTDSAGSATFWLNPLSSYTVTASKEGYDSSVNTITPSSTTYTISMGSGTSTSQENLARGITTTIKPILTALNNDTIYNFNFTIDSDYWSLDSFGFILRNGSAGTILGSSSSTQSAGGVVGIDLNTGNNNSIFMDYFWEINGTYNNATVFWIVYDTSDNGWSLQNLFSNITIYLNSGLFGLTSTGLYILVFFVIFVFTGVMSYKFGITSPAAISAIGFILILFFDVGLSLIPNPVNAVPHFPTIFMFILVIALFLKEATQ